MTKALLLLLVASPVWADKWVDSTPRTHMRVPDDATPMANPPLGDNSDAVAGWELAKADAVLLVQRGVTDGPCEHWVAEEHRQFAEGLDKDAGATLKLEVSGTKTTMLAIGTQQVNGTWVGFAMYAGCVGPEGIVVTATSRHAGETAMMSAILEHATKTLEAHGHEPARQRVPFGTHTVEVPAPAYQKPTSPKGMTMYSVPGTATVAVLPEDYSGDCEAYLVEVLKHYTDDRAKQTDDAKLKSVVVERTGDIVWRVAKQHAIKGPHDGQWYANITASTCQHGVAGSLLAISFDEVSTKSELSPGVVARLRALLAQSARSIR